jgi:putative flippase GtrA
MLRSKEERIRFLKFIVVGLTGAVVDFGVLNLLRLVLNVPLIWAQAISFICAVINNFLWNRFWTYPDSHNKKAHKQLIQFFIINIIGILIRTPLLPWVDKLILKLLNQSYLTFPLSNQVISQNLALAISITIILLWNYFANRFWTYNNVPVGDKSGQEPTNILSTNMNKKGKK